jgi:microcystin-dependent protein
MVMVSRNDGNMEWVKHSSNLPIGTVVEYIGKNIPNGWLECNGQFVSIIEYDELFNILDISESETKDGMFQIPKLEGKKIIYCGTL